MGNVLEEKKKDTRARGKFFFAVCCWNGFKIYDPTSCNYAKYIAHCTYYNKNKCYRHNIQCNIIFMIKVFSFIQASINAPCTKKLTF